MTPRYTFCLVILLSALFCAYESIARADEIVDSGVIGLSGDLLGVDEIEIVNEELDEAYKGHDSDLVGGGLLEERLKGCTHYRYYQKLRQPGMHIWCVIQVPETSSVKVSVLVEGSTEIQFTYDKDWGDNDDIIDILYNKIENTNDRDLSEWAVFNYEGDHVFSVARMVYEQTTFLFTNGIWLWPGAHVGFQQTTPEGMHLTTLSLRPLVFRVSNFLSDEECDYIRDQAEPHMIASTTKKMDKDVHEPDTKWRTSTQHFLQTGNDKYLQAIDKRVAKMTKTSTRWQESVQVLRYLESQKYDQHTDYFDPDMYQKDPATLEMIEHGEKNRLITVLWYLSTPEAGGHTIFPRSFGQRPKNSSDCSSKKALKIAPKKGEAIIFYSLTADGGLDPLSLHGACPVEKGIKWGANKWVWTGTP